MKKVSPLVLQLITVFSFFSCATKKDIIYTLPANEHEIVYQATQINPGDILDINISAQNMESVLIFKRELNQFQNQQPEILKINGYLVDANGNINLPVLGTVNTTGLSTIDLSKKLEQSISEYVINPQVSVRLVNYKISILGEVARPGTYTFLEERISLPQVLGQAGDLTINGDRRNIQLLRYEMGKAKSYSLDLTDGDLVNPEYFFLNPNDVIYVRPNTAKVKSSGLIGNVGTVISVLSLLLSLTIVLTR
jgi:polysaccharide export outer membrane protein